MVKTLRRLESGVDGLDTVLGGGLVVGGSYIIQGRPGAGKTILANQIAFHHARANNRVLFVTLLAESHERLFQNLSTFDFYDENIVGDSIEYVSAYATLRSEGLHGVVTLLRNEIARRQTSLLVLDGLLNIRDSAGNDSDIKTFVVELHGHAAFAGCTVIFLTSALFTEGSPEHTMVDGVIELRDELFNVRTVRELQIRKSRGSKALGGLHQFEILDRGVVVYPRLESIPSPMLENVSAQPQRLVTGIAMLDDMTAGGFPEASFGLLIGPSGSGKTTLGLQFLSQSNEREPGLHFGFYELPDRLKLKAASVGIDVFSPMNSGALHMLWQATPESLLDAVGYRLLDAVKRRGVKRLFIDGLGAVSRSAAYLSRLTEFLTAIARELQILGVTTLATWETNDLTGRRITAPLPDVSCIVENLILLHSIDVGLKVRRFLSVLKVRDSVFDTSAREAVIGDHGIVLKAIDAEDVLQIRKLLA